MTTIIEGLILATLAAVREKISHLPNAVARANALGDLTDILMDRVRLMSEGESIADLVNDLDRLTEDYGLDLTNSDMLKAVPTIL
jgi:hypothetical protein